MLWTKKGNVMDSKNRSYVAGDSLTMAGAERLMEVISQYWKDKGKEIKLWMEPFTDARVYSHSMFQIRSNLHRGLPK